MNIFLNNKIHVIKLIPQRAKFKSVFNASLKKYAKFQQSIKLK
jgi:hypothetical protein